MFFFQNLSGAAVINYYSPTLFASIGIADPALYTGIYGVFKAVGSFIFFGFIIDRSGRRIPWLISASVCAFCLLWVAIFLKVAGTQTAGAVVSSSTKAGGISAIAAIMIYSTFWSFGGNGLPWIVSSEIFPGRVRSLTGSFAATCQWIISYAATQGQSTMPLILSIADSSSLPIYGRITYGCVGLFYVLRMLLCCHIVNLFLVDPRYHC